MRKRPLVIATVAASLLGVLLAGVLGGAVVVYAGWYNVASTEQHLQPVFSLLETAMRQSVKLRARHIEVPPLDDPALMLRGAACFRDKCVQCHGAPGVAHKDIGKSMQPLPGPLVDARQRWQPAELYWLTRHGIKMSGMPAWQHRLTDEEIWAIVGFLQQLPDLGAPQYAEVMARVDARVPPPASCGQALQPQTAALQPASAERGRQATTQYACNACHNIPGVTGGDVHVGPPLQGFAGRALIAGTLPTTYANLVRWLRETQQVKPGTAMPQLDVSAQDAADIAAYLLTLE